MKKIYALFMTLCLVISATAAPLAGVAKKSYPLYQPEVVKAELALDAMQKAPAATQGLQYDAEAGELIRYYNETDQIAIDANYLSQGNLYVDIMAGDYSDYLSLLLFVEDTVEGAIIPEGTYPITSEPAYNTALASQGYSQTQGVIPCAYYPLVEQGGQLYISTPMYFMQSGNVVVEHVNGNPKITINAVNSNNVPMTIVFEVGGKSEKVEVKAPLQYDATAADGALDYTYGEDAVVETTDKGFFGTFDVADATSMLALLFVYPEGVADAETTIPAGTYTISDSQDPGTVLASSGVSSTGGVGYSFFANVDAEGYLEIPLYFLVSGTVEVTNVDGQLSVEVNGLNSNDVPVHVVYSTPAEPEYALEETIEISNLTTEILTVGDATYLQLTGRNDMLDSDVMLFLNNYTGEDDDYEVNAENSLMTFGGIELTVIEGVIAQTTDDAKGKVYTGRVIASAEEEGEVMLVALDLVMYATPAVEVAIEGATARVDEETGSLVLNAEWTKDGVTYPVLVLVAGYEEGKEVYEGAQISELQIGDDDNWLDFAVANTVTVSQDGLYIALEGEYTSWATGATYALNISGNLPEVEEPGIEMVGVVKRAVQNGDVVIVLTHEADGTAHIYQVVDGKPITEVSQEGVIAVDAENAGDYLAISDIAVTEDGKLVATNYMQTQSGDDYVDAGYKRGETRIYIWNDLHGDPSILFTSKMSSNWFRSKQGLTMAVKGTSDNMEIFMTGIHATKAWARASSYRVIDGVYVEPEVNHNDHYFFYDINDAIALETTVGTQYELNASPLGEMNWVLDAELINPTEIVESATNNVEIATSVALTEDLGKKYNGASYVVVDGAALMAAPFANPDGQLVGVEILNITNGFDAPQYVDMVYVDEAVAATAAATAVEVVEGGLNITLVADATIHTWFVEMSEGTEYEVYEDEITNLVIDLDNLILIGGPSSAFQVDVFLGLGEYNRNDDTYQLLPESSIAVMGSDATFIEGYAYEIDAFAPSAKAVVRCEWNGMKLEFHLTMTAAPMEATVVVVENAVVEVEKYVIWGDMYDYALKMTGEWVNEEDGLTYPVLVEVPVYYPDATEPSDIMSTVTVGGWGDEDPWLGFGEGTLTVTTVDNVVTATGIVQNPMAGVAIDITISGSITPTGVENATVTVKPVKMIQNGQLIIKKGDAQFNVQGAQVK